MRRIATFSCTVVALSLVTACGSGERAPAVSTATRDLGDRGPAAQAPTGPTPAAGDGASREVVITPAPEDVTEFIHQGCLNMPGIDLVEEILGANVEELEVNVHSDVNNAVANDSEQTVNVSCRYHSAHQLNLSWDQMARDGCAGFFEGEASYHGDFALTDAKVHGAPPYKLMGVRYCGTDEPWRYFNISFTRGSEDAPPALTGEALENALLLLGSTQTDHRGHWEELAGYARQIDD